MKNMEQCKRIAHHSTAKKLQWCDESLCVRTLPFCFSLPPSTLFHFLRQLFPFNVYVLRAILPAILSCILSWYTLIQPIWREVADKFAPSNYLHKGSKYTLCDSIHRKKIELGNSCFSSAYMFSMEANPTMFRYVPLLCGTAFPSRRSLV